MAGTDTTKQKKSEAATPVVILVEPQLGQNIGMVARAMLNCGLTRLRLVKPRDAWPNKDAVSAAAGADKLLDDAGIYETAEEAVADLNHVFATTVRERDMTKTVHTPRHAAALMHEQTAKGRDVGILFGKESKGLTNDDVALGDAIITVPLNPGFSSLNLAQAVMVVGYEWMMSTDETAEEYLAIPKDTRPATREEMIGMFEQLEAELDACGFLRVKEKRPVMVRNIRNMFLRANMTEQEVRTMRGIISGLTKYNRR